MGTQIKADILCTATDDREIWGESENLKIDVTVDGSADAVRTAEGKANAEIAAMTDAFEQRVRASHPNAKVICDHAATHPQKGFGPESALKRVTQRRDNAVAKFKKDIQGMSREEVMAYMKSELAKP